MAVEIKNILVPADGSEHSTKAAEYASTLARGVRAAVTLLVVHGQELKSMEGRASLTDPDQHVLGSRDVKEITHQRYAAPAFEAAIAAMGSRGMGQFKSMLLGSVSYQVLRKSSAPLLVIQ